MSSAVKSLLSNFTGAEQLRLEKNRLEAFLSGCPGEYCGFSKGGDILYSENALRFLSLDKIETIQAVSYTHLTLPTKRIV